MFGASGDCIRIRTRHVDFPRRPTTAGRTDLDRPLGLGGTVRNASCSGGCLGAVLPRRNALVTRDRFDLGVLGQRQRTSSRLLLTHMVYNVGVVVGVVATSPVLGVRRTADHQELVTLVEAIRIGWREDDGCLHRHHCEHYRFAHEQSRLAKRLRQVPMLVGFERFDLEVVIVLKTQQLAHQKANRRCQGAKHPDVLDDGRSSDTVDARPSQRAGDPHRLG
mmetsp:Transcript_41003/g.94559  ORF Transcript_41003/g.94559 Transcript_41003/m.94559 type:complete len:221 (-) Transcript_41003:19-681(-)